MGDLNYRLDLKHLLASKESGRHAEKFFQPNIDQNRAANDETLINPV